MSLPLQENILKNCTRCDAETRHIVDHPMFEGRYGKFFVRFVGYECTTCGYVFSTTKQRKKNRKAMNRGHREHEQMGSQLWS